MKNLKHGFEAEPGGRPPGLGSSQTQVPGYQELLADAERLNALVLSRCSAEERVRGLAPEDRLRGLSAIERDRLLELLLKQAGR